MVLMGKEVLSFSSYVCVVLGAQFDFSSYVCVVLMQYMRIPVGSSGCYWAAQFLESL